MHGHTEMGLYEQKKTEAPGKVSQQEKTGGERLMRSVWKQTVDWLQVGGRE